MRSSRSFISLLIRQWIESLANSTNFNRRAILYLLIFIQVAKACFIAVDPFSDHWKDWYFGFHNDPPYSFTQFHYLGFEGPVPYSMLWYALNWGLTAAGIVPYFIVTWSLDTLIVLILARVEHPMYSFYLGSFSWFFLLSSPQDFLIWIFLIFGRARWYFVPLAVAAKFPLIPPILNPALWDFLFHSPVSIHDPHNGARYALMIAVGMTSIFGWAWDRSARTRQSRTSTLLIESGPCHDKGLSA